MKHFYLAAAIVGAIVPYIFFAEQFGATGGDLYAFMEAAFANGAAGGFAADLLISSFIFWIAMAARHRSRRGPSPLLFIVLNLTIGLSCALPAYFYAHEVGHKAGSQDS